MVAILEHAKQILKDDYKLIPCTSGKQALEILPKRRPDLILLDINMPDMDGYEVLKRIKNDQSYHDIPVILITTELTTDMESKGFEFGADDFIIKPFSQITMLKRISNQLA